MGSRIQSGGRLRRRYLPALYLDPSFFACYVAAAVGVERPHSLLAEELPTLSPRTRPHRSPSWWSGCAPATPA